MSVRGAETMGIATEFRAEVERWVPRLLRDPGWDVVLAFDDTNDFRAEAKTLVEQREATIIANPTRLCETRHTACHEVVHILLRRLCHRGEYLLSLLPEELQPMAREVWQEAKEETTEEITRAFLAAYEERDSGEASHQV